MRAILFGPTGSIGNGVLRQCLHREEVTRVAAVTRRPLGFRHEKLVEVICADFERLDPVRAAFRGVDACLFCLGVSASKVSEEEAYRRITVGYALAAARMLKEESPDAAFHFVSGMGTDASGKSRMMWARVKGEAERELSLMGLGRVVIWRPGFVQMVHPAPGKRPLYEVLLKPALWASWQLRGVLPGLVTDNGEIGDAMIQATLEGLDGKVLENRDFHALADRLREDRSSREDGGGPGKPS